jgi:hypothetical protein
MPQGCPLPTQRIQRDPVRDPVEPRRGIVGDAALGPGAQGPQASFGKRVLGQSEIAEPGGEGRDDAPARRPKDPLEGRPVHSPSSGRISIEPSCNIGTFLAIAMASSRSAASIR